MWGLGLDCKFFAMKKIYLFFVDLITFYLVIIVIFVTFILSE